jgi:hypothetical protein
MMLSFPDDSIAATDDVAIKSLKIGRHWCALYAGDPSCALSIVTRADDEIRKGAQFVQSKVSLKSPIGKNSSNRLQTDFLAATI